MITALKTKMLIFHPIQQEIYIKKIPVELLFDLTVDGDHLLKILDDLLYPQLSGVHAVPGPLQVHLVAGDPGSREGDD